MWPFRRKDTAMSETTVHIKNVRWIEAPRIEWGPNDVGILYYPGKLSVEAVSNIKRTFEDNFPGHKCVVLEEGMSMGVLHASDDSKCHVCGKLKATDNQHKERERLYSPDETNDYIEAFCWGHS